MSAERPQNFANHPHIPKWFLVQAALSVITLGILGWVLIKHSDDTVVFLLAVGVAALAINTVTIFLHLRFEALLLQDRIIRLEMRVRLSQLLPADLQSRIAELTLPQLVALRFASDAELPELVRKVLTDKIADRTAIKKMVKDWQADWMRV